MIAPALTISTAFRRFVAPLLTCGTRTLADYRHTLNRWEQVMPRLPVTQITTASFQTFRKRCHLAPLTVEKTISAVLMVLTELREQGIIEAVPKKGRKLKIPPPDPDGATLDELNAMLQHVDAAVVEYPDHALKHRPELATYPANTPEFWRRFLLLAYFTGFRRNDLRSLTHANVTASGIVRRANKTGKRHAIPIHPALAPHVAGEWSCAVSVGYLSDKLERICDAAGTRQVTCQQIRILAVNEYERAHPGAGAFLQGSGLRGSLAHYLRADTVLERAVENLRIPASLGWQADDRSRIVKRLSRLSRRQLEAVEVVLEGMG